MDEYQLVMAEALAISQIEEGVHRAKSKIAKQPPDYDGLCVDCEERLPDARIIFGAITCLYCQTLRERTEATMRS